MLLRMLRDYFNIDNIYRQQTVVAHYTKNKDMLDKAIFHKLLNNEGQKVIYDY